MLTSSQELCRTEAKDNEISAFALDNIEVNYWTENPQQDKDNVGLKNMSNIMTGSNISTRGRVNSAPQDIMLGNDKRKGKRVRNKSDDAAETSTPKSAKTSLTPRGHLPAACKNPASVAKRNARERRRIKNVNLAFDELREHVPSGEQNKKKISKVDTLQSAIIYIKTLERLVMQKRKQEEKKTNNQEVDTDLEKASSSTEASILDEPAMPGSTIGDDICSENTSIVNSDLSPMLDEFDGAISTSTSSSHPSMVEDVNDDIVSNIEFDDSGYSEGSPGSHCERDPTIHHPSLSNDITYQETCVATDKSGLREVSAYDVETFLDNPMTAVETSSTVQQFSPPYTTGHGNFAYPQSCTIPTQSWFNCPESSPTPYQQQFSPLPLASTPRNENVQKAFVFPPPNTVPFVTQQQAFSESSDVSTIRPTVYEPHTVYEGYRFGGTFA